MAGKKLIALGDLHGILPELDWSADYLLIAGDIVPLNVQSSSQGTKKWIRDTFNPWCSKFEGKVIIVAGNHDIAFERHGQEYTFSSNVIYLENEFWSDDTIQVYGTPLCKIFGNWAFMRPQMEQKEIFDKFQGFEEDDRIKIVLSHDAPYGTSDVILDKTCAWYTPDHLGNKALTDLITRVEPDINIHGHLHSTSHNYEYMGKTASVCVSYVGEDYKPTYSPYTLEV